MACLLDARATLPIDASLDACDTSEYTLAQQLWPQLSEQSLVLADEGFTEPLRCDRCGIGSKSGTQGRVVQTLGAGNALVSLDDPKSLPAGEMLALYHGRWEIELAYAEMKTEVLCQQHDPTQPEPRGRAA